MRVRTRRRRHTAVIGTVAGALTLLTLLAVAAAGNAVDTTPSTATPSTAAPTTSATAANTTAVADGAIPPALLQRRDEVFDRIARLRTTRGELADFDFSVGVNPDTNTLVVDVFSDKSVKLPDLGAALELENHVGGQLRETAGASGGAPGELEDVGDCTMGFAVRINNSPNAPTGFLTVAHCFDETKPAASSKYLITADNGENIDGVGHKYGNRSSSEVDWGVVALKKGISRSNHALGQVKTFANNTIPLTGASEPFVGMKVCKYGTTTQTTCGEVTAVGVRRTFGNLIEDGLLMASVCAEDGDSGGPLFTDHTPNETTVEGVGITSSTFTYSRKIGESGICGEKVGKPNLAFFVPLSLALTQANAQAPQNDISLVTQ